MPDDYYDQSAPSEAQDRDMDNETPDEKMALVSTGFFKDPNVKVGDREMVEIVKMYDGEVAIKCVYGDEDKEEREKPEMAEERMEGPMMEEEGMMG